MRYTYIHVDKIALWFVHTAISQTNFRYNVWEEDVVHGMEAVSKKETEDEDDDEEGFTVAEEIMIRRRCIEIWENAFNNPKGTETHLCCSTKTLEVEPKDGFSSEKEEWRGCTGWFCFFIFPLSHFTSNLVLCPVYCLLSRENGNSKTILTRKPQNFQEVTTTDSFTFSPKNLLVVKLFSSKFVKGRINGLPDVWVYKRIKSLSCLLNNIIIKDGCDTFLIKIYTDNFW